jgi:hypothetical protein
VVTKGKPWLDPAKGNDGMGGYGSGPKLGVPRGEYFTRRKRQELELWEMEQARQKELRRERQKVHARELARQSAARRRARLRAAGLPLPRGGREPSGASTPRVARWRRRHREEWQAWDAAIAENKRRDRRIARGLPATPKTSTERARESRERKASQRAIYLESQWWSPELSEKDAKAILVSQHPSLADEMELQVQYAWLLQRAKHADLNVNYFVIADASTDGIALASERRAIFYELYKAAEGGMSLPDIYTILKQSEAITSLKDLPSIAQHKDNPSWQKNVEINARDRARTFWGSGCRIYKVVLENI